MSDYSDATKVNLTYEQLNQELASLELPLDVSKLHGILTGCLVFGGQLQAENYLRSLLLNKTGGAFRTANNALFALFSMTHAWLGHFGFDFKLILPQDTEDLMQRVSAFTRWCQGLLEGFDLSGLTLDEIESEEVLEILQHMDEFSQMDAEDFDYEDEEDEKAFLEITEYVRLAVLHILCDLNEQGAGSQEPVHH
jgi:uncharacterized protein YgfB (UPF0149 family)